MLELTFREALRMGHNYIGTEHILLALAEFENGTGVLADLGIDKAAAEAHISFIAFVGAYALAVIAGIISHVPGGIGVFEATMLTLAMPQDRAGVLEIDRASGVSRTVVQSSMQAFQ